MSQLTRTICRLIILLLLVFGLTSPAQALTYNVVDAGGAWPQDVLGTYTENGTNNGKPCYEGPNGYWLYFTQWYESDYWFIGKPLGNNEISNCFYISSSSQTPPLDINFFDSQNTSGAVKVTTSGGSPPPTPGSVLSTRPSRHHLPAIGLMSAAPRAISLMFLPPIISPVLYQDTALIQ